MKLFALAASLIVAISGAAHTHDTPENKIPDYCISESQAQDILFENFDLAGFDYTLDEVDSNALEDLKFINGAYRSEADGSADFGCGGPECDDDFSNSGTVTITIRCDGKYSQEFSLDTPAWGGHD